MPADSRDMVLVPREPTEAMISAGSATASRCGGWIGDGQLVAAYRAMLSASPARGEGDAPPHGYLVKDFADGWFWTRDASLACADGAAVWSLQHGRYETSTRPTPATPAGEELREIIADLEIAVPGLDAALAACQTDVRELVADLDNQKPVALAKADVFAKLEFPALHAKQALNRAKGLLAALQPQAEGE